MFNTFIICLTLTLSHISHGYPLQSRNEELKYHGDEWSIFQKKLGLSWDKVELLRSQKNQQNTINLLHRFIEENPKYVRLNADKKNQRKVVDPLWNIFQSLFKNLRSPKQMLKTSLNIEFHDSNSNTRTKVKRSPRKIAVRMVDDISTEKIDELLKLFVHQNGIEDAHLNENGGSSAENNEDIDYATSQIPDEPSPALDPDYMYESLYEDDQGATSSSKTYTNAEFRTLQDLILQANKKQW